MFIFLEQSGSCEMAINSQSKINEKFSCFELGETIEVMTKSGYNQIQF